MKIAFIGGGNMARAIISGLCAKGFAGGDIAVKDPHAEKREFFAKTYGVKGYETAGDWIGEADLVVLAVKPQVLEACLKEIAGLISEKATVLSIAAAVSVEALVRWSGKSRIVRCLPNTPAMVGSGFSGLFAGPGADAADRERAQTVMQSVGECAWFEKEDALHLVTGGPGSGPAYVFLFMQGLSEALVKAGAEPEAARQLAIATVSGAAKLAASSDASFEELRAMVTSKGGTTARAIEAFEAGDLRGLIGRAVEACIARSKEMAGLYK